MTELTISQKHEQVKKKLESLGLEVSDFSQKFQKFIKNDKRFFYSPCFTKKGVKVFIKIAIKKNQSVFNSLMREAIATKLISRMTKIKIPKYYESDFSTDLPWFIHEYIEGDSLGCFYELNKKYNDIKFINPLLRNLEILYQCSEQLFKNSRFFKDLKKNDYQVYYKTFLNFKKYAQKENIKIDFQKTDKLLEESKNLFMKEKNYVIVQGDFKIDNNIVSKNGIYIIDWESIHINNFADDIGRIWIRAWLYPKWRRKLLLNFIGNLNDEKAKEFKQFFRIVAIMQSFSEIGGDSKVCEKKFRQGVTNASLATIDNAVKGFEYLL